MVGDIQKGVLAAYGNHLAQFGPIDMQKQAIISETKASALFQLVTHACASENEGDYTDSQQAVVCFTVGPGFTQGSFVITIQHSRV